MLKLILRGGRLFHGGEAETTVTRSPDLEAASGRPPGAVSFFHLGLLEFFLFKNVWLAGYTPCSVLSCRAYRG